MAVARGAVTAGFSMSHAGVVAHSSPKNAHKVSVAVAVVPCASERRLRAVMAKCDGLTKNRPANPTMASGTSLRTAVTTWTRPAAAMPRAFTAVRIHTAAIARMAAEAGSRTTDGTKGSR